MILFVNLVLTLWARIWTLAGEWPLKDEIKWLWGILSLLVLGLIANIVFAAKLDKQGKQQTKEYNI